MCADWRGAAPPPAHPPPAPPWAAPSGSPALTPLKHHILRTIQGALAPLPCGLRAVAARAATLERGSSHAGAADVAPLVAIEVPACRLAFGEHLRVVGSCPELGGW